MERRSELVILDPSFIFEEVATDLFKEFQPDLRLSAALERLLVAGRSFSALEEFGRVPTRTDAGRVLRYLRGHRFSWRDADLSRDSVAVRDHLLKVDDPLAEIFADEWVFLASQSWGMFESIGKAAPRTIEMFRKAGAHTIALSRGQMDRLRKEIQEQTPDPLRGRLKEVGRLSRPGATIVLGLGGAAVTIAWPPLGLIVTGLSLVPPTAAFIYGDP